MKKNLRYFLSLFALSWTLSAEATLIDFEGLPDLVSVNELYAAEGVHFSNAISLTAGFSLNEFDYPPSSGVVAIGDDFAPIEIRFDNLAYDISAFFTYASQLTFSAYGAGGALIGVYVNPGFDNLGSSEQIALNFFNVESLIIAGEFDGSYIMDDLGFTTVPAPGSGLFLLMGLLWIVVGKCHNYAQSQNINVI
jgi:hypothetical protein